MGSLRLHLTRIDSTLFKNPETWFLSIPFLITFLTYIFKMIMTVWNPMTEFWSLILLLEYIIFFLWYVVLFIIYYVYRESGRKWLLYKRSGAGHLSRKIAHYIISIFVFGMSALMIAIYLVRVESEPNAYHSWAMGEDFSELSAAVTVNDLKPLIGHNYWRGSAGDVLGNLATLYLIYFASGVYLLLALIYPDHKTSNNVVTKSEKNVQSRSSTKQKQNYSK